MVPVGDSVDSTVDKNRSTMDLLLLKSIDETLRITNARLVLDGGYAVEAVMGGVITRSHHDIDIIVASATEISALEKSVKDVAQNITVSAWYQLRTSKSWIWLRTSKDETDLSAMQLNIHVISSKSPFEQDKSIGLISSRGLEYDLRVEQRSLFLPKLNKKYIFSCPIPEIQIAGKMRLLSHYAPKLVPRQQDLFDFQRLFSIGDLDYSLIVKELSGSMVNRIADACARKSFVRSLLSELCSKYPDIFPDELLLY